MAYVFQNFIVNQVLTAAQVNQIEANIRDHIHGSAGVTDNFYTMTVVGSASINGMRVSSGGIVRSGKTTWPRIVEVGSTIFAGSYALFIGGGTNVVTTALPSSVAIGDRIMLTAKLQLHRVANGLIFPVDIDISTSGTATIDDVSQHFIVSSDSTDTYYMIWNTIVDVVSAQSAMPVRALVTVPSLATGSLYCNNRSISWEIMRGDNY